MISVKEAKEIVLQFGQTTKPIKLNIMDALGYVVAKDVLAICDIPAYPQSSMDGYAFMINDKNNAIDLVGEMAAGTQQQITINQNQATRIFTGAPLPIGADTVVMQENTTIINNQLVIKDEKIEIGNNVRQQGAETKFGSIAMSTNTLLTPASIGFLASIGIVEVAVFPAPNISIILTGDELQSPGNPLQFGQVYEASSFLLIAALQKLGIKNINVIKVKDDLQSIQNAIESTLQQADIILLAGGVSVGDYDFVTKATEQAGIQKHFHKIKQRPGKPLFFGTKNEKIVFGLPGNPSSSLVCFYQYVMPLIEKMMCKKNTESLTATLTNAYKKTPGLSHFLKGIYKDGKVTPLSAQESFLLNSFAQANCLIELEEEKGNYEIGETAKIYII